MKKTVDEFAALLEAWNIVPVKRTLLWIEYRLPRSVVDRVAGLADAMSVAYDAIGETFVMYKESVK